MVDTLRHPAFTWMMEDDSYYLGIKKEIVIGRLSV